jgi:DNA repair protein SbcC/Rad50
VLEKIEIKNFQSHEHTTFNLHEGINVITGTSDVGKSSTIRAIEWLQRNRPRGTAFMRDNTKSPTSISMKFDGVQVQRTKSKSVNAYKLDKNDLKVVGTNVPTEITQFLNLDEISIQGQHDKYFLLQDTPGEVAKKLNKVAGFEIIDQVMKSVKSAITNNTTDIKYTKNHIVELEEDIKQYEHLEDVEKKLTKLQKSTERHQEKFKLHHDLENLLTEIENTKETILDLEGWLELDKIIQPILDAISDLGISETELDTTKCLINDIQNYKTRIKALKQRVGCEVMVQGITNLVLDRKERLWSYNTLIRALQNISVKEKTRDTLNSEISKYENQLEQLLKEHKLCPLCGTKLTAKTTAHMKEHI